MAVKKRILECECGEMFVDGQSGLGGCIQYSPWTYANIKARSTKTKDGHDLVVIQFTRTATCGKCKGKVVVEKKQIEMAAVKGDEGTYEKAVQITREVVMQSTEKEKPATSTAIKSDLKIAAG